MASAAQFLTTFPEFTGRPGSMIQAALDDADAWVDPDVWGAAYDRGHCLLAAHFLALGPQGSAARLSAKTTQTTYGETFAQMRSAVACGYRP